MNESDKNDDRWENINYMFCGPNTGRDRVLFGYFLGNTLSPEIFHVE